MELKLIACNIVLREACYWISRTPHRVDPEFIELGEHACPDRLRLRLQACLDAVDAHSKAYDAVLLLFGLCGTAVAGLKAGRYPLVLPRAHDCATLLLGSRAAYQRVFGDFPSLGFSSCGYMERGQYLLCENGDIAYGDAYDAYVAQYGEDNARYIWESLHAKEQKDPRALFIAMPETASLGHAARFRADAEAAGRTFVAVEGNSRLIENLLCGRWEAEEYLRVPPGHVIRSSYDNTRIVHAVPD